MINSDLNMESEQQNDPGEQYAENRELQISEIESLQYTLSEFELKIGDGPIDIESLS